MAVLGAAIVAFLSLPVMMYSFDPNPPIGYTGAPGQHQGCASCHGTLTTPSALTVTAPSSYTPGGAAVSMTVSIPSSGGFELVILTQSGNAQAGTLTAGTGSQLQALGAVQDLSDSASNTSWTFSWTPPATNVGSVVLYATGGTHNVNYLTSYTITAPATTPATLAATPTPLSFTVNGATPPTQPLSITSGGSPIAVTISASTTSGGNWLTVIPPGGNTPVSATVGISAAGVAAGTYQGTVSITSASATNSPLTVPVTLNVTTPIPPSVPTLTLGSASLSFTGTAGGTVPSQNVMVSASDGSAQTFSAAATVTTPSGGTWLTVGSATGTTPTSEPVSVNLTGLAAGTYTGSVVFTSSGASNSPVTLPVTLTVNSSTPPPPLTSERFSMVVVDSQSGGSDWLLVDGSGSVSSSGQVTGSGFFTRFRSPQMSGGGGGGDDAPTAPTTAVVENGSWRATSLTSFTPVTGGGTGGTLVLQVQLSPQGGTAGNATMTIASTGSTTGVTLAIQGESTFMPAGIGMDSITSTSRPGGGGGGGGDDSRVGTGGTPDN